MSIISISLTKLVSSPFNVRKTDNGNIDDLAASIAAHGLIQCLVVRATEDGKYEVVAGSRRLAAMKKLAKAKRIPKNFPVPCSVLNGEDDREISLAENQLRKAMHPADQFDAFKALADNQTSIADIAARFGVTERMVEQRLKLASVSPALFGLYRDDQMTLEQLMAFTVSDDHERQEAVWKAVQATYDRSPHTIRHHLAETKVSSRDPRAVLIGEAAFRAAGGTITRDLFSERDECLFEDAALLDKLVSEQLEHMAETVRAEGWAWVEVSLHRRPLPHLYRPLPSVMRDFTEAEQAEMDRLVTEADELAEIDTDDEADEARYRALHQQIDALEESCRSFPDDLKAQGGTIVYLDRDGSIIIERGFTRTEDGVSSASVGAEQATPAKAKPEISVSLLADLTAHRTMAMRCALASNPEVALDTLLWTLAMQLGAGRGEQRVCQIRLDRHFPGESKVTESKAGQQMEALGDQWNDRLPVGGDDLWHWLREANQTDKLDLLAFLTAASLNAVQEHGKPAIPNSHQIHQALRLDMTDYWEATAEAYLSRVPAAKVLAAVREAVSPEAADALTRLKKADLVRKAERKLCDLGWLPAPLRFPDRPATEEPEAELAEAA